VFRGVVEQRSGHEAVAMLGESVSYGELDRRTARMARALLALGAGKGARIVLMAPDGIFWLTAILASLRIGALVSLASTLCKPPELAHILRNSDAQILIGVREFLRNDYVATLTAALPGLAGQRAGALRLPEAPYLRSIWLDDARGLEWAGSVDDLLARADAPDAPDQALLEAVEREVVPADEAVIMYTSGSTAFPKAVVHRQWTVAREPQVLADYFLIKPSDRMMPLLPAFWVGGLSMALMVLCKGATLVYPDSPAIEVVMDTLRRLGANRVNSWGPLHGKIVAGAAAHGIDVEAIGGLAAPNDKQGHPIPPELQANLLGMTESFSAHSGEPFDEPLPADKPWSSGRPINAMERRVVDPETGELVAVGEVGELQIRGRQLMSGFYKMEPWRVFTADGFYPTGDLVRIDTDDHLFFVARRSDIFKSAGANVSRLEVETALKGLPGVDLAVVVAVPDADLGQRVLAAVVPCDGAVLGEASLTAALRERLSSFKVPRRIVVIAPDDVRRTASSKISVPDMTRLILDRLEASPG
jgi:acyl-CoA synthetase (AMP-forming)/AMP-acid ligase II